MLRKQSVVVRRVLCHQAGSRRDKEREQAPLEKRCMDCRRVYRGEQWVDGEPADPGAQITTGLCPACFERRCPLELERQESQPNSKDEWDVCHG